MGKTRNVHVVIGYANPLFGNVARLHKTTVAEAVCREIVGFAVRLGFDRVTVCGLFPCPGEDGLVDELLFIHSDRAEKHSVQKRDAYLLYCPVTWHILGPDELFFWSKSPSGDPACMAYRTAHGVCDLDQANDMQVPMFNCNGPENTMSFAGGRLDLNAGCKLAAQTFCPILFFAPKRLRDPVSAGDARTLSEHEREALRWIALGKQQAEVAVILMISERTVESHLRTVRHRLGAVSIARAMARALCLGDIEV